MNCGTQTRLLAAGSQSWKEAKASWLVVVQTNNQTLVTVEQFFSAILLV